ncbi:hypothetical protein D3C73_1666230 [compost metagenome]
MTVFQRHQRDVAAIRAAILGAHADPDLPARARALSDRLYPSLFGDIAGLVRARLLPLLG